MTPEQAGQMVLANLGTPGLVVTHVRQNDTEYAVTYRRANKVIMFDTPIGLVDKQSGAISYLPYRGNQAFFDAMTDTAAP
jgi:hypothetical protein